MPLKIERTHSRTLSGQQSNYKQSSGDWSRRLQSLLPSRRSLETYHDKPRHEAWPIPPREVPRAVYYGSPERKKRHVSLQQFPDSRRSTPLYSNQTTPTQSTDSTPYHSRQPSFEALYMKSHSSTDGHHGVLHRDPSVSMTRSRSSNKEARFAETRYTGEQAVMTAGLTRPNRLLRSSSPLALDFLHCLGWNDRLSVTMPSFDARRLEEAAFYDSSIHSVRLIFQDWNEEILVQAKGTNPRRNSIITVWDILLAISRHLSEAISMSTWYGVSAERYTRANENRVARRGRTLRKIDCLPYGSVFGGLRLVSEGTKRGDAGRWLVLFQ